MATTRKRSSGFSEKVKEEVKEQQAIEQLLEEAAQETFENLPKEETSIPEYIPQEITPTEDVGPRFVEPAPITYTEPTPASQPKAPPKRHPRNIPKFSRFK